MSQTGACGFYLGVESGSQKILNFLKKDITVEQTREAFRLCHKYRIKTAASVVVGVPTETKEDINETLSLLSEVNPTVTWFNVFVGIPNSDLYQYALDNKLYEFIAKNRYINSSGSFIAARNLTIDNAPTRPRDKASEDLTMVIMTMVVIDINTKLFANLALFDKARPYRT